MTDNKEKKKIEYFSKQESEELEKRLLSSIFKRNDCLTDIIDEIKPHMLQTVIYQKIYGAMVELFKDGTEFDDAIVYNKMDKLNLIYLQDDEKFDKQLKNILYSLTIYEKTSLNGKIYAKIIKQRYGKKQIEKILTESLEENSKLSLEESINNVQNKTINILKLSEANIDSSRRLEVDSDEFLKDLEYKIFIEEIEIGGLESGFRKIDISLDGFYRGGLTNFTGASSAGKTNVMLQIALNRAIINQTKQIKDPIVIYSIEMNEKQMTQRLLSQSSGINGRYIKQPRFYFLENDIEPNKENVEKFKKKLAYHLKLINSLNIIVDYSNPLELNDLISKTKKLKIQHGQLDMVFIDHTDILNCSEAYNDVSRIKKIYEALKGLAKEINTHVFALHQFNGGVKDNEDYRPSIFNLKWGQDITNNCDNVLLLYRPEIYDDLMLKRPDLKHYCDITYAKTRDSEKPNPQEMFFDGIVFKEK